MEKGNTVESEQKKPSFFGRHRNVLVVVAVLVAAFVIFNFVDGYLQKQDALRDEENMALYILNEAKLADGEEIESITYDVTCEKCKAWGVCGFGIDCATEIYIKSTQREWVLESYAYPGDNNLPYTIGSSSGKDFCEAHETSTDEVFCFHNFIDDADKSTWTKTLDDITVHYDNDRTIGER